MSHPLPMPAPPAPDAPGANQGATEGLWGDARSIALVHRIAAGIAELMEMTATANLEDALAAVRELVAE